MSQIQVNPQADLPPRPGDERLSGKQLEQVQLFATLKKKLSFEKFPNSIVLRRYKRGEIVCRQGDAGASAFYVLTGDDLRAVRGLPSEAAPEDAKPQQRLTAHLFLAEGKSKARSWWKVFGRSAKAPAPLPRSIAIDGPSAIDGATRCAPLFEGEVFGEMSCMTMSPRSATVVADGECYLLEFLRNIFDQVKKDAGYQQRLDVMYRDRVLANHLRRLDLLADVSDDDLAPLREQAQLVRVEPGNIIFDQGDPPDAVYLIRSGLVQAVLDPDLSLREKDVLDWDALAKKLTARASTVALPVEQAAQPPSAAAQPPGKPSAAAEMLAKMKAKKEAAAAQQATSDAPASTPAEAPPARPAAPKAKPSVAEILAAAKAKEEAAAAPPAAPTPEATSAPVSPPAETPKPAKLSPAEMLAAAKAKKEASASVPAAVASPIDHLWQSLDAETQAAATAIAADATTTSADSKALLLSALNARMRDRIWLLAPALAALREHADVAAQTKTFTKGLKGIEKDWTDLEVRVAGRVILELILAPSLQRRAARGGPPRVLSYLSRGDIFGEMGVIEQRPRAATIIAYDHPPDPQRSSVPVDLVRIPAAAFQALFFRSPLVQQRVAEIIRRRKVDDAKRQKQSPGELVSAVAESPDFQELGLIQGQKLLLVDLDRCTRCGDCVRACIDTHDDGRSRLFLDGPRFDRYLVPSACRNCHNPACMIGCPVGSIQRGPDGQIEIKDWCIGCKLCAEQCPYDSIQMHELGLVPSGSLGWTVAPSDHGPFVPVGPQAYLADKKKYAACTWDIALQLALGDGFEDQSTLSKPLVFRREFDANKSDLRERHELSFTTQGSAATITLNGRAVEIPLEASQRRGENKKLSGALSLPPELLRVGRNRLEVHIAPPVLPGDCVLDLEIAPAAAQLQLPEGVVAEVKQVSLRAVVCDLCSSVPTGPACVHMCPHDAAIRVDARTAFAK